MQRDQLLDSVERLAELDSREAAEDAVVATLLTLGEHVSTGEAEDLAAGLPDDYAETVTDRSDEAPESFSVDEFVDRVAERERREGVDAEVATRHVRAVMAALADAGLQRELEDAREQLPNEFATLFETDELAGESR